MKKTLILGILGLAASVVTTYGQGTIQLDNYDSTTHPLVTYGAGSGGTVGAGVNSSFSVGLYYVDAAGNWTSDFAADPSGTASIASLYNGAGGALNLASGVGATGGFDNSDTFDTPGEYALAQAFNPGLGQGVTVTVMVVAYNGTSYAAGSSVIGHSTAFTMTSSVGTAFPELSGNEETDGGFQSFTVTPEPSVFALSGIGAAALMLIRRKK